MPYTLDLQTNAKLIKYYLSLLKLQQEEFIQNYQSTNWEKLTSIEQKEIINRNLLDQQNKQLEARITINNFFRLHREKKKNRYRAKSKSFQLLNQEETLELTITLLVSNINTKSNTISKAVISINKAFTTDKYNPEHDLNHHESEDLIDWDPNAPNSQSRSPQPPEQRNQAAKATKIIESLTDLVTKVQQLNFKRIERAETTLDDSMEVDRPLTSLAATQRRPTPAEEEIQIITHQETTNDIRAL
ncbi:hypothetical protein VP01_6534g1, partial [Puccinia sorghi]